MTVFAGADRNFEPSVEAIEAARTEHTKAIIVNTPNNPTGAVWKPETVKAIAQWAIEHHVWVISDEIYEHLNYDAPKPRTSAPRCPKCAPSCSCSTAWPRPTPCRAGASAG